MHNNVLQSEIALAFHRMSAPFQGMPRLKASLLVVEPQLA